MCFWEHSRLACAVSCTLNFPKALKVGDFPNRQVGPIASTWAKKPTKKRLSSFCWYIFFECFFFVVWGMLLEHKLAFQIWEASHLSAVQGIDISHPEMAKKVPNDYDRIRDGAEVEVINSAFLGDRQWCDLIWQYVTMTDVCNPASDLTSLKVAHRLSYWLVSWNQDDRQQGTYHKKPGYWNILKK